ncbi:serine hydrolase [bacterium]|nr:serine hydrolase [Akkermansiaceae bacterium]MDB4456534.1 serine hydrolase [bacterium]MDB4562389.1 serine hydrolase [Akkermansiaceae bacterium]MDB4577549.1 serine hydrolase [bacterium]
MKLQRSFLRTVGQRLLVVSLLLASPVLAQESYLAVEAHSGKVLIELNADTKRPVASLTKIATAMVVIDWSELSGSSMGQMAVVPPEAAYLGGFNPMGMIPGDRIALRDAMYSMLLGSDNVAAQTLADHVGRSIITRAGGSDPVGSFVGEMNNLARAIGMTRTKFANPHGMDTARQKGTSTARDMARLSIYAMRNTGMQYYTKQTARSIGSYRGNARRGFKIKNTHELVGSMGVDGIKAGNTVLAGPCLATSAVKPNIVQKMPNGSTRLTPRNLIIITLGSPDRFGRTRSLIEQGWPRYEAWSQQGRPVVDQARELLVVPKL